MSENFLQDLDEYFSKKYSDFDLISTLPSYESVTISMVLKNKNRIEEGEVATNEVRKIYYQTQSAKVLAVQMFFRDPCGTREGDRAGGSKIRGRPVCDACKAWDRGRNVEEDAAGLVYTRKGTSVQAGVAFGAPQRGYGRTYASLRCIL